jgi:predicted RNase H-like nuclease
MNAVVGIDARPRGWVAVRLASGAPEVATAGDLAALIGRFPDAPAIAIDMPIGLSEKPRECDLAARRFVGSRRSSVFITPPADVLFAPTYDEANRRSRERYGTGISRQAYALRANVRVVDELAAADPRLIEVHPEVSFRALLGEVLVHSKSTWNGQAVRRRALADAGIRLPELLDEAGGVPPADVLDAAVAAWSARRFAAGDAEPLPADSTPGSRPVIWF